MSTNCRPFVVLGGHGVIQCRDRYCGVVRMSHLFEVVVLVGGG